MPRTFERILVANRSEIAIRVFRACTELGIRTIGICSKEDRGALHRYKADETYNLPEKRDPLKAYLDIDSILAIAREHGADAIHPGYGFLSENPDFARACEASGVVFIGPPSHLLEAMGDKTAARRQAQSLGIPVVPGTDEPLRDAGEAVQWAKGVGFPVILKASFGGGGRGMRVARSDEELAEFFTAASREAEQAFGRGDIFIEKFLARPKHIEVQILADAHGHTLHLFERDCSVQRRHQKVIEIAPSPSIDPALRDALCDAAVRLAASVGYVNAGTVEFLVEEGATAEGGWYFIEMNPRIQVEHTVTEMITGVDIVKSQIHVAEGRELSDPLIGLPDQAAVQQRGFAIQCRVTTEDPANNFIPDYGRITHYRSAAGFGIRLDGGTAYTGAIITPFYDSLLVKLSAQSLTFTDCCHKLHRALSEFRVRGVKTNIPFLDNVVRHPVFLAGQCTTRFIEETPELFQFHERADRASKLLEFIGNVIVNGNPTVPAGARPRALRAPVIPQPSGNLPRTSGNLPQASAELPRTSAELPQTSRNLPQTSAELPQTSRNLPQTSRNLPQTSRNLPQTSAELPGHSAELPGHSATPEGTRDVLKRLGAEGFSEWVKAQRRLLVTDTTLRDAHQSLLATRVRTLDMLKIADAIQRDFPGLFSLEMWGGATFDVTMRFLYEDPWDRLAALRERVPGILFQMLLRGSNAVGYTNYPDNVVKQFVKVAAREGIDVFRIFDSLNYVPAMIPAIEAVRESGAIAEAAVCYTGDLFDPARSKYNLAYYVRMARQLEGAGATMLAIKDMAGLLRPYAARRLVETLRQEIGIPIHLHTHDTAGGQTASLLYASEAGVDVVDTAISSMSGLTSQPSMEALVAALQRQERDTGLDLDALIRHADYWGAVREIYQPFESDLKSNSGDVYLHEIPGGQYSNLRPQAEAMGVGDRLPELKRMYAEVNKLLGDIVKVTPSSKVVGDMALYMMTHNLTPEDVVARGDELQWPESIIGFLAGEIGFPEGGFPPDVQSAVLKGRKPLEGRLAAQLPPADFNAIAEELRPRLGHKPTDADVLSWLMYPKVFTDYSAHHRKYSDVSRVETPVFLYGMEPGDETTVEIEEGKTLFIKLITRAEPDAEGNVTLFYELNGAPREVKVPDKRVTATVKRHPKADPDDLHHVGAPMPGAVVEVAVKAGQEVDKDQRLIGMEAMKVQMYINSPRKGKVKEVLVHPGVRIDTGDLLVVFE